jgi:peptide chain release factor subunit 3
MRMLQKGPERIFSGQSLLEHMDHMPMVDRKINAPLMMPISEKYKDMGTVIVGKVESGHLRKGDHLVLMPNKDEVETMSVSVCEVLMTKISVRVSF